MPSRDVLRPRPNRGVGVVKFPYSYAAILPTMASCVSAAKALMQSTPNKPCSAGRMWRARIGSRAEARQIAGNFKILIDAAGERIRDRGTADESIAFGVDRVDDCILIRV